MVFALDWGRINLGAPMWQNGAISYQGAMAVLLVICGLISAITVLAGVRKAIGTAELGTSRGLRTAAMGFSGSASLSGIGLIQLSHALASRFAEIATCLAWLWFGIAMGLYLALWLARPHRRKPVGNLPRQDLRV